MVINKNPNNKNLSIGLLGMGLFLLFGTVMASLAASTLLWPGTPLDRVWRLNPAAYRQLAPLGRIVGIGFIILAAALAAAAIGWFQRHRWAWRLTVVIMATQLLGDLVNCLRGEPLKGLAGAAIASALLLFLFRGSVKGAFA
jgi:hypothetical protein